MTTGSADYPQPQDAQDSPLAQALFAVEGVQSVFLGSDFVSVTKSETREWFILKPYVLGAIMEHFTTGRPVILVQDDDNHASAKQINKDYGADQEIVDTIVELIDTRIRPAVARDGGDIMFHDYEAGIVYLTMKGACAGCPSASMTLKSGIENLLKHYVP